MLSSKHVQGLVNFPHILVRYLYIYFLDCIPRDILIKFAFDGGYANFITLHLIERVWANLKK